eukprot:2020017-Amphidinium_carterae.3
MHTRKYSGLRGSSKQNPTPKHSFFRCRLGPGEYDGWFDPLPRLDHSSLPTPPHLHTRGSNKVGQQNHKLTLENTKEGEPTEAA